MKINEIFKSISGEAAKAGFPVIFIRTYGCNLRCSYCDTMYAVEGGEYKEMTPKEILETCENMNLKRVVFTGGEPLIQPDAAELVDLLCNNGYEVEIETNGAVSLPKFHQTLRTKNKYKLSYTMDYKGHSSLMTKKMIEENLEFLLDKDVLKFVVGCSEDLMQVYETLKHYDIRAQVFISPVFGKIEPKEIVDFILTNSFLTDCRVQLQLHKLIWDVNQRGV